jgi:diguanylate cyclase (GGDEF)-like protein
LLMDIDHFKAINDEFGHQIGDDVLKFVAARIKSTLRDGDIVGRYGGDEFGIILREMPLASAKLLAERIRNAIRSAVFTVRSTSTLMKPITVSIGLAELFRGMQSAVLVEQADKALYAAKRAGRNIVVLHADVQATERMEGIAV